MFITNSNFNTYNALAQKKPVVVVQFSGISTYFCTGTFSGITSDYKKYLRNVRIKPSKIDPLKFRIEASSTEFEIIDDSSGTVLTLINANNMLAKQCTIKIGFQELAITDFITLELQYIDEMFCEPHKIFGFKTKGKLVFEVVKNIFLKYGFASHVGNAASTDDHIHIYDHEGRRFTTAGAAPWGDAVATWLRIDQQFLEYDSISESAEVVDGITTDIVSLAGATTCNTAHGHNAPVKEIFKVLSHGGFTFLMNILTSTNAGTNGDFDTGADEWGMGITASLIDHNQIRNEIGGETSKWGDTGNDWHAKWLVYPSEFVDQVGSGGGITSYIFRGPGAPIGAMVSAPEYTAKFSSVNALDWIEQNILPFYPAYFIVTDRGKIGFKVWDVGEAGDYVTEILEDEIISIDDLELMDQESCITHIIVNKKMIEQGNSEQTYSTRYQCDASDTAYGERRQHTMGYWDMDTEPLQFYINRMMERVFGRYGNPPIKVKMKVFAKHQILQVGDKVAVTHSKLPNVAVGTYGWTQRICEIAEIETEYGSDNRVDLTLMDYNGVEFADVNDIHVWNEAALDVQVTAGESRKILTEEATNNDADLDAQDSFLDQTTYSATHVMVGFELTLPAAGGGIDDAYITVTIHVQNPESTDVKSQTKRIYYDETASGTQYTELYVLNLNDEATSPLTAVNVKRVKCDWTAHSGANAPSAVSMTMVKFWNFKATISSETIR